MSTENQPLAVAERPKPTDPIVRAKSEAFEMVQREAAMYAQSTLVPENFRGPANRSNVVIALEMANRIGANPLAVMQNIYIVHGKPSWSSTFIISVINTCGRFEALRFDVTGTGDDRQCIAWTTAKGNVLPVEIGSIAAAREKGFAIFESPAVTIRMAKDEGWSTKNGSKWKTMPDLMLRYRAATFFGRLYAPELLMGMRAEEELRDVIDVQAERVSTRAVFTDTTPAKAIEAPAEAPQTDLPQNLLANYMVAAGVSFEDFRDWLKGTNPVAGINYEDIDSYETVPTVVAERLLADEKALSKCAKTFGKPQ
jgi:hypothetical protein